MNREKGEEVIPMAGNTQANRSSCSEACLESRHVVSKEKPDFRMACQGCGMEFSIKTCYDELCQVRCPCCGSGLVKELYVSYPLDGPGFQSNYSAESAMGGCAKLDKFQISLDD